MSSKDQIRTLKKSKSSIFDLFSRPEIERGHAGRDALPNDLPAPPVRRASTLKKPSQDQPLNSLRPPPAPTTSLKGSKSVKSLRSSRRREDLTSPRVEAPFEPPPLFQAYPQAMRHTILDAPGSSHGLPEQDAETGAGDQEPSTQEATRLNSTQGVFERLKARRKSKVLKTQSAPSRALTSQWSRKIYLLVTTGYLLQYSGHGPFDRLPEKILKITPDSAAFASDAIEGKHWVLQVVQEAKGSYVNTVAHKTFLAKVGLHGNRKVVPTLLLVFSTPGDMDKWMMAIRKQVESLGGAGLVHGIETDETEKETQSEAMVQRRYSGIVRQPSVRSEDPPLSPITPTTDASTMVASQRTSGTTAVGSTAFSSSRSSKAPPPALLFPVGEAATQYSEPSYEQVIGPAPSSPSFFERQPSPLNMSFPQSPSEKSSFASHTSVKSNGLSRRAFHPVPEVPTNYTDTTSSSSQSPERSRPAHSTSSQSSPEARNRIQHTQESTNGIPDHQYPSTSSRVAPGSMRVHHPTEHPGIASLKDDSEGTHSVPAWPVTHPTQTETYHSSSLTRTPSMEPISEAPPMTPGTAARAGKRPTPLKLNTFPSSTNSYTRRSSLAPPGEPQSPRFVTSKRTSVFNKPIPLKVTPPSSNRASVQFMSSSSTTGTASTASNSATTWSPAGDSPSAQYFTPPSTAGMTPTPTAALFDTTTEKSISRPSSIYNQKLTISSSQPNPRDQTHSPAGSHNLTSAGARGSYSRPFSPDIRQSTSAVDLRAQNRTSTQVPIVRPPIRSSLLRSRASANGLSRGLPPPPNPPPNAPLPATPAPSSSPPAVPISV